MMTSKYFVFAIILTIAASIATVVAYPHLPATVPTHWDIHNQPNGYSPKSIIFIFGPGLMSFFLLLTYALPWLSPKQFEVDTFRDTYLYIMLLIITLLAYTYGIVLWAGMGHAVNIGRAIIGGISLLFALLGNVMGKIRRNFYVGVRTPWALANERVWNATHRFAAKVFVIAGLTGLALTFFDVNGWLPMLPLMAAGLVPVIYSLVIYKQMESRGELTNLPSQR
jgi:uncharacterized membrane protein